MKPETWLAEARDKLAEHSRTNTSEYLIGVREARSVLGNSLKVHRNRQAQVICDLIEAGMVERKGKNVLVVKQ